MLAIKAWSWRHPVNTLSWRTRAALPLQTMLTMKTKEPHLHPFFLLKNIGLALQDVGLNLYGNLITMVGKATIIGHMNISRQTSKQNW